MSCGSRLVRAPSPIIRTARFLNWYAPSDLLSCWIALDDTSADGGTVEFVRGSHKWPHAEPEGEFHGPEEYRKYLYINPMLYIVEGYRDSLYLQRPIQWQSETTVYFWLVTFVILALGLFIFLRLKAAFADVL